MEKIVFRGVGLIVVLICSAAFGIGQTYTLSVNPADSNAYATVQSAIDAVPDNALDRYIIEIAPGNYHERMVTVGVNKQFVTLRGMGTDPSQTRIHWGVLFVDWVEPLNIAGYNIRCENLTADNTTGSGIQANALKTLGDKMVFENCRLLGYQDTFYCKGSGAKRNYLHNCYVAGHTDYIYGDGIGLHDDCNIMVTFSLSGGHITAASTPWEQKWGLIFRNCNIIGDSGGTTTDLGRPWKDGSMTTYMNCWIESMIRTSGWVDWDSKGINGWVRYSEYGNTGPGAQTTKPPRIYWSNFLTDAQAAKYTTERILAYWNPNDTNMPDFWLDTTGYWDETGKWQIGMPDAGLNVHIPPNGEVTVRQTDAQASCLTLDNSAKLYIDGNSDGNLTVRELACRGTTSEVHLRNGGILNVSGWAGFTVPSGVLYIESGSSFTAPIVWWPRIVLAPAATDSAHMTIKSDADWLVDRIQTGSGTTVIDMNGGDCFAKNGLIFGDAGANGNVTFNLSGGRFYGKDTLANQTEGTYTINQTGGDFVCDHNDVDGYVRIGRGTIYNLSEENGRAYLETKALWIGDNGSGSLIQKAGSIIIQDANTGVNYRTTDASVAVRIGKNPGAVGYYEIQGGKLTIKAKTRNKVSWLGGFVNGVDGTGTFKIIGGKASISLIGTYRQGANGTLAAENKDGAISTINIAGGDLTLDSGAKLLLTTGWGAPAGEYLLMKWSGIRTGTFILDPSVNPFEWSFRFDDSAKKMYVKYTPQNYVNFIDLAIIADNWMMEGCDSENDYCDGADVDKSGEVDLGDIKLLAEKWLLGK